MSVLTFIGSNNSGGIIGGSLHPLFHSAGGSGATIVAPEN